MGRGCRVFIKYEGLNPTGSFKDRGMTVAISKALEAGARSVICASTGNTSAAAAAYAARAGMGCYVLLPAGKIALGKLTQSIVHNARVVTVDGNFDDALRLVREAADSGAPVAVVNSINPHRIEGQKTAAFEIIEDLGEAPDAHLLPVGNAGNVSAYWRGYREFHALGRSAKLPRMVGFQAAGAAPIFHDRVIDAPETLASAIRIGNPGELENGDRCDGRLGRRGGHRDRRGDPARPTLAGGQRGHFRGTGRARPEWPVCLRCARVDAPRGVARRVPLRRGAGRRRHRHHRHRPRFEGPRRDPSNKASRWHPAIPATREAILGLLDSCDR